MNLLALTVICPQFPWHLLKTKTNFEGCKYKPDHTLQKIRLHSRVWSWRVRDHSFRTHTKFSEKLTFLTLWYAHVRFSGNFACVLNGWSKILFKWTVFTILVARRVTSNMLHFIWKPVIWLVLQIKWLVSLWNATLGCLG